MRRSDEAYEAFDAHRSATILTFLVFLWGSISLLIAPWEPFWIKNVPQTFVGLALLVYFWRTRKRPQRRIADIVSAIMIVYSLVATTWTSIVWIQLGRPAEAFTVPELGIVAIASVFAGHSWRSIVAVSLFAAERVFVVVYAHHVGLVALVPIALPITTLTAVFLAMAMFLLSRRRRDLARRYVRVQGEVAALKHIRPLFVHAHEELDGQVNILAAEARARGADEARASSTAVGRALERLGDLRERLLGVVAAETPAPSPEEAERRLRAHDAQLGSIFFAGLGTAVAVLSRWQLGHTPWFIAMFVCNCTVLIYVVSTRRHPSARRALAAVLVVFVSSLAAFGYNQWWLLEQNRPFAPLMGHKLLMGVIGLTLATRFRLGVVLILVTLATSIILWFVLDFGARPDIVPVSEPWVTVMFTVICFITLRLSEERQMASIRLLHAEAEASAVHRRAQMLLALRDRLNSPLQTLVIGADITTSELPKSDARRVQAAIDRLVDLSHKLAVLDVLAPRASSAFDPNHELRPRL